MVRAAAHSGWLGCLLACALGCGSEHSTAAFEKAGVIGGQADNGESAAGSGASVGGAAGTLAQSGAGMNDSAGGAAGTGAAGSSASAGTGGTAGLNADDASVPAAGSAAPDLGGPCPPTFECVTDPLLNALSVCLVSGPLPTPVSCMTDAECVAAGLPKGTCVVEEETGLTGCVQTCTPEPEPTVDPMATPTP
jgi:hypothetical protein